MHKALTTAAALALGVALLTGCGDSGGDDDSQGASKAPTPRVTKESAPAAPAAPKAKGLDGTWRPINESPIVTLTVSGDKVTTTGKLACPGTISQATSKQPRITLSCAKPDPNREKGDVEMKPDGSALVIQWDGPEWGGLIDSMRRA